MTFPRDTEPMRNAIIAALTKFTGQPRCLPQERLFILGDPKDLLSPPTGAKVYGQPRCWVAPVITREIETSGFNDRMRVACVIEIRCWYHAGSGVGHPAWDAASARWSRDALDVLNALTYPGALYTDPAGNETGLDGYCLRSDDARHVLSVQPLPRAEETAPVIVQVGHVFTTTADLLRPA